MKATVRRCARGFEAVTVLHMFPQMSSYFANKACSCSLSNRGHSRPKFALLQDHFYRYHNRLLSKVFHCRVRIPSTMLPLPPPKKNLSIPPTFPPPRLKISRTRQILRKMKSRRLRIGLLRLQGGAKNIPRLLVNCSKPQSVGITG